MIHGIWLDNGELTHLLEWKKAGGQLLQEEHSAQLASEKQRKTAVLPGKPTDYSAKTHTAGDWLETDLISLAVGKLLDKLFGSG